MPLGQVVLKGIDKGDITSSGAPQVPKDGPAGRNSIEFTHSRRNKIGILPVQDILLLYICAYFGVVSNFCLDWFTQAAGKIYRLLLTIVKMKAWMFQRAVIQIT